MPSSAGADLVPVCRGAASQPSRRSTPHVPHDHCRILQQHRLPIDDRWHPANRRESVAARNFPVSHPSPVDRAAEPVRSRPIRSIVEAFLPWNWLRRPFPSPSTIFFTSHSAFQDRLHEMFMPGFPERCSFSWHLIFLFVADAGHPDARKSPTCSRPPRGRAIQ
jgi:hypothetical protein